MQINNQSDIKSLLLDTLEIKRGRSMFLSSESEQTRNLLYNAGLSEAQVNGEVPIRKRQLIKALYTLYISCAQVWPKPVHNKQERIRASFRVAHTLSLLLGN